MAIKASAARRTRTMPSSTRSTTIVPKAVERLNPSRRPSVWARQNSPARAGIRLLTIAPIIMIGSKREARVARTGDSRTRQRTLRTHHARAWRARTGASKAKLASPKLLVNSPTSTWR